MPTLADAAAVALALPGATEGVRYRNRAWFVGKTCFAWERPLSKADIKRYGEAPLPEGPLLGVTTGDLGEKEAVLSAGRPGVFTIAHFEGYPAVLIALKAVRTSDLRELVTDAWLCCAPPDLAQDFLR
ncbi:MAG: hypothetical protein JWN31_1818 [Frankiales bacterium]|nr:hypothetical protein [Frankiales bacterium]